MFSTSSTDDVATDAGERAQIGHWFARCVSYVIPTNGSTSEVGEAAQREVLGCAAPLFCERSKHKEENCLFNFVLSKTL